MRDQVRYLKPPDVYVGLTLTSADLLIDALCLLLYTVADTRLVKIAQQSTLQVMSACMLLTIALDSSALLIAQCCQYPALTMVS